LHDSTIELGVDRRCGARVHATDRRADLHGTREAGREVLAEVSPLGLRELATQGEAIEDLLGVIV
jgi:hypothetical protein